MLTSRPDGRLTIPYTPPMQAREAPALPTGEDWLYEYQWGGERVRAIKRDDGVLVLSRDGRDVTNRFPRVAAAIAKLRCASATVDGEILYIDGLSEAAIRVLARVTDDVTASRVALLAFDLLALNDKDVRFSSLLCRRLMLAAAVQGTPLILSPLYRGAPEEALEAAKQLGLRGLVAKRGGSAYRPSSLHSDWVKVTLPSGREAQSGLRGRMRQLPPPAGPKPRELRVGAG